MGESRLVYMANQIATYFRTAPRPRPWTRGHPPLQGAGYHYRRSRVPLKWSSEGERFGVIIPPSTPLAPDSLAPNDNKRPV